MKIKKARQNLKLAKRNEPDESVKSDFLSQDVEDIGGSMSP